MSATFPKIAAAIPAIPNAKPKKNPDTNPTFPGSNSCAYIRIAVKADDKIKPIKNVRTHVQSRSA